MAALGIGNALLGVHIETTTKGLQMSQTALINRLVPLTNMQDAKPTKSPISLEHPLYEPLTKTEPVMTMEMNQVLYRKVLGILPHLSTRTHPDLRTVVSLLSKFASQPTQAHWKRMKQVIRYLAGIRDIKLSYRNRGGVVPQGWSEVDWGRNKGNRRSRSGVLTINNAPVMWSSRQQSSAALSTAEAEFAASTTYVRDISWVRDIFHDPGLHSGRPTRLIQDKLGSIAWTAEVQGLRKVKHIGMKYKYVKETVDAGVADVQYVTSNENRADLFTKAIVRKQFPEHRSSLSLW